MSQVTANGTVYRCGTCGKRYCRAPGATQMSCCVLQKGTNIIGAFPTLTCSCAHKLDAPTPELLEVEWQAHRREVKAGEARPLGKVPGYTFGGRFE